MAPTGIDTNRTCRFLRLSPVPLKVPWRPSWASLDIIRSAIIGTAKLTTSGSVEEHAANKKTFSGFAAAN
jgi:hypothetical protein